MDYSLRLGVFRNKPDRVANYMVYFTLPNGETEIGYLVISIINHLKRVERDDKPRAYRRRFMEYIYKWLPDSDFQEVYLEDGKKPKKEPTLVSNPYGENWK